MDVVVHPLRALMLAPVALLTAHSMVRAKRRITSIELLGFLLVAWFVETPYVSFSAFYTCKLLQCAITTWATNRDWSVMSSPYFQWDTWHQTVSHGDNPKPSVPVRVPSTLQKSNRQHSALMMLYHGTSDEYLSLTTLSVMRIEMWIVTVFSALVGCWCSASLQAVSDLKNMDLIKDAAYLLAGVITECLFGCIVLWDAVNFQDSFDDSTVGKQRYELVNVVLLAILCTVYTYWLLPQTLVYHFGTGFLVTVGITVWFSIPCVSRLFGE